MISTTVPVFRMRHSGMMSSMADSLCDTRESETMPRCDLLIEVLTKRRAASFRPRLASIDFGIRCFQADLRARRRLTNPNVAAAIMPSA